MPGAGPTLSVVVAARHGGPRLETCLAAILDQCTAGDGECLVVGVIPRGPEATAALDGSRLHILEASPRLLVPELWARGIAASRGDVVVLTTGDCVPDDGWLATVGAAPWDEVAAVGGTLELDEPASMDDRAVFGLRYARWAPPQRRRRVQDLAADNAAYRRDLLVQCREEWNDGFWEPFVHRWLEARGHALLLEPRMRVRFRHAGSVPEMLGQRYRHGRWYATSRMRDRGFLERLLRAVTAPALPPVLLWRILVHLRRRERLSGRMLPALPLVLAYLIAWSAGEATGYVRPLR